MIGMVDRYDAWLIDGWSLKEMSRPAKTCLGDVKSTREFEGSRARTRVSRHISSPRE